MQIGGASERLLVVSKRTSWEGVQPRRTLQKRLSNSMDKVPMSTKYVNGRSCTNTSNVQL
jgi:hypothetical protein